MSSRIIGKRKGRKYRTFDTQTGAWSKWIPVPDVPAAFIEGYSDHAASQTVPELRHRAARQGLNVPSKVRKNDLLTALARHAWDRSYRVRADVFEVAK